MNSISFVQPNIDLFTPKENIILNHTWTKDDFKIRDFYIWNYEPKIARLVRIEEQRKEWEDRILSCRLVDNCGFFIDFEDLNNGKYWLVKIKADEDKFDFYKELFNIVWSYGKKLDTTMLKMLNTTQEKWDISSDRYLKRHYGWGLKEINNILKDQRELDNLCIVKE